MTQTVVVQVGQCGNQIGCQFWERALAEHAATNQHGRYDAPLSSLFRNVDTRVRPPAELALGDGRGPVAALRARAVLIDMEEGVVNELRKGRLGELFDPAHCVTSVSGSGNNWAVGYHGYGQRYGEVIRETVRQATELCDCLQSFLLLHSMGGGTGSGLGSHVLGALHDDYPGVFRFVTAVYPSEDDDVVTSPYNSVLAMHQLQEHADAVFPVENQALQDIVQRIDTQSQGNMRRHSAVSAATAAAAATTAAGAAAAPAPKPWDKMNNIVATMLLNLTSGARYEGALNVDMNEITTNLVPFPKLHFLVASQTPLYALADVRVPPRRLDQMFTDAFDRHYQLMRCDPRRGRYMACALMLRGRVEISDVRRNIDRIMPTLNFVPWNPEGWKTGLCSVPPLRQEHALLCLANNTCIRPAFQGLQARFLKLFRKSAYKHHFTAEGMDEAQFGHALESLRSLLALYGEVEAEQGTAAPPRLRVI